MIRRIAICGVIWLLAAGAAPARTQNIPDAPAPHTADPHAAQKPGSSPAAPPSQLPPASSSSSSSDDNAFPEDQSKAAAKQADGDADAPAAETGDKKTAGDKSAADDNAFPEDKSRAAAEAAGASGGPDTDSPGVSSSRKNVDEKGGDAGLAADLPKQGEVAVAPDPKRAAKDVQVGKFYLDSKNYKGAYARFKEATTLSPEDPEILFLLAESARRLDHLDEAVTNYKLCLQLDPDGPKSKAAKRALAEFDKLAAR